MKPIKIVIADDHHFLRTAWKIILENDALFTITGLAGTGEEAVSLSLETEPDIVLMDMSMPIMDGMKATRIISSLMPQVKILGVSAETNPAHVRMFLDSGAVGYVSKYARAVELKEALRQTADGRRWICPVVQKKFMEELPTDEPTPRVRPLLSRKEALIAQMMQKGLDVHAISSQLDMPTRHVHVHHTNIVRKLGIRKHSRLAEVMPQLN